MSKAAQIQALQKTVQTLLERVNASPNGVSYANLGEMLVDDTTAGIGQFDVPANIQKAEIYISRSTFPTAFYTELGYHRHGGVCVSTHTHSLSAHVHSLCAVEDLGSTMQTLGPDIDATGAASGTGNSSYSGVNGGTLATSQKTDVDDNLDLYFTTDRAGWGTAYDKASTGFSALGDIDATNGTGWIDITTYLTAGSMMWIKIVEPTAGLGGRVLVTIRFTFADESTI